MADQLAIIKKDVVDVVTTKIREFQDNKELFFPPNYSPENAMKQAWLILQSVVDRNQKPALEVCTKDSIANSLLDMVVQGLSPAKKQGYFIVYGSKLQFQRSYFGTMAVTKRLKGVKDIFAQVVYAGDEFEFEIDVNTGVKKVTKHKPKLENIDPEKIIAAYCVIFREDGVPYTEIMNIQQIKKAWEKSKTGGAVHKEFPEEMAKKTVINRACKPFVNTSDDSDLLIEAFNNSDAVPLDGAHEEAVTEKIKAEANKEQLDIVEAEYKVAEENSQVTEEAPAPAQEKKTAKAQKNTTPAADPGF
jgi:recombination protein RecT